MSQTQPSGSFPSNLRTTFSTSIKAYERKTKKDLLTHPLMTQLQTCKSPSDILAVLHNQVQEVERGDDKLTKWLGPTIKVLCAFSGVLGEGAELVFSPEKVIFAGAGILLLAAQEVPASRDALIDIFERIENFFVRLEVYTEAPTTISMIPMKSTIAKIMVGVLGFFAIVTKDLERGAGTYLETSFGRRDVEDSLSRLDTLTQGMAQMATARALRIAHDVDLVQQMENNIEEARRIRVRGDQRTWLCPPDPSTSQNVACRAQHPGTTTWFFQGNNFMEWKCKSTTSLLWVHGKPGSGKTILCSAIVQDVMALRDAGLASMAYFYFDFRDVAKQSFHNLLSSLLTQLSTRSDNFSKIISRVYQAHDHGTRKPSTSTLIACLKEMFALPNQGPIYIILDALDECPAYGIPSAREQVLNLLEDLVRLQLSDLRICVTSRPEVDIRTALEPLAFCPISLHDESGQKRDIEDYIRFVVYTNSNAAMMKLRGKDRELVVETLTERADGMFRWVFCQLEVLRHCLPQSIRRTLHELPRSLDETYERVLNEIGPANRDHVHRLLQCLTVAIRPLRVEELTEILVLDFDGAGGAIPMVNEDWQWESPEQSMLSMCSSLITLVRDGDSCVIQFSHFSVKEFLTSDRLAARGGDASRFRIIFEPAHTTLAQACLGILLQLDTGANSDQVDKIFPLARYASRHWVEHAQFGTVSSQIEDGMRRLFDSTRPYFLSWLLLHDIDDHWTSFGTYWIEHRGSPLYYASLCGFWDLAAHIVIEHPEQVNARGGLNHSPLAAALHKRHFDVAELLYLHGAAVDVTGFDNRTLLQAASLDGLTHVVEWLIDHGAVSDSRQDSQTPSAATGHLPAVPTLLEHSNRTERVGGLLTLQSHDNPIQESSEITTSLLNPGPHYYHSQSSSPPSRDALISPLPTIARGRWDSFRERWRSPVPNAAARAPQHMTSITNSAPQATPGVSAPLPTVSLGGEAAPATTAFPSSSLTSSLAPSRSRSPVRFPEHVGGSKSDGDVALTPLSTLWSNSKRKRTAPIKQAEGYIHTRSRAIEAIGGALGTAASIGHEALFAGVDLLQFAPVPGLNTAGNILLNIWDAIELVEDNRQASLRLAERCADILISIRNEIADAGYSVAEELRAPIAKLVEAFEKVHRFLDKVGKRPFIKRFLRRNEILSGLSACDTALKDALDLFDRSIQLRTLKLIQVNEQRQKETHDLLKSLSHVSPALPHAHVPSPPLPIHSSSTDPESVRDTLRTLRASQNAQDRARDMADLYQLMRAALAANDDVAIVEVLQIARSEMPEAIKTLERALERIIEDGQLVTTAPLPPQHQEAGKGSGSFVVPGNTDSSHSSADTLDREFIQTGIGALRRLSKGADLGLPSWTITRFEIDLEAKVGVGFFSNVYRGTWRNHTVAVKVLSETTPRKIFLREVGIWKSLYHPNVLELFGASSASGDPPWFLVSKYYPRGNLVKYLKGLSDADAARVDALKMIHEISKGMAYLHKQGVLHGDLKAANILVDDDTRCVISDFGQSEIKSEVYRLTRASEPRGTLRWQAPELMQGAEVLTQEMDVYAFAICCGEILTMGALPWPFMDDYAVQHSVLNENMRPSLPPPSDLVNDQLLNVIRASWDRFPSNRPSFEQIVFELKTQRARRNFNLETSLDLE